MLEDSEIPLPETHLVTLLECPHNQSDCSAVVYLGWLRSLSLRLGVTPSVNLSYSFARLCLAASGGRASHWAFQASGLERGYLLLPTPCLLESIRQFCNPIAHC
jgi:hypothetical protein